MTINKAQDQIFNNLGVYLTQLIFPVDNYTQHYRTKITPQNKDYSKAGLLHRTKIMLTDTEETQEIIQNNFGK